MKGALEKFRAAHALGNTPHHGHRAVPDVRGARSSPSRRARCASASRASRRSPRRRQRSKDARNEAARLAEAEEPKIGTHPPQDHRRPAGWRADASPSTARRCPLAALERAARGEPGRPRRSRAKVGNGPETRATLETHEGETRDLELAVQPPPKGEPPAWRTRREPTRPPPPPQEKRATRSRRRASSSAASRGGIGAIAGLVAISKKSDLDKKCTQQDLRTRSVGHARLGASTGATSARCSSSIGGVGARSSRSCSTLNRTTELESATRARRRGKLTSRRTSAREEQGSMAPSDRPRRAASSSAHRARASRSASRATTLIGISDFKSGECTGGDAAPTSGGIASARSSTAGTDAAARTSSTPT